jgi:hypothetical protein
VALIYAKATLSPSKRELLAAWLPAQAWAGDVSGMEAVGAYRFDDPDGEVGIETHLLRTADGRLLQVPLTYRGAPLDGSDAALLATTEHSALGTRWVYDGCADPAYVSALAAAILTGGCEAQLEFEADGRRERRDASVHVSGSGNPAAGVPDVDGASCEIEGTNAVIRAGDIELVVRHVLDGPFDAGGSHKLSGTWPGSDEPTVLALAR